MAAGISAAFRSVSARRAPHGNDRVTGPDRGTFRIAGPFWVDQPEWRRKMLDWAVIFLVVALVAAAFGFGGIATTSSGTAQVLCLVFLVFALLALLVRRLNGRGHAERSHQRKGPS
jgi:uncharacterized membrane protein YtjA (UPF0391 family)